MLGQSVGSVEPCFQPETTGPSLIDQIEAGPRRTQVSLSEGRSLSIESAGGVDRLQLRSASHDLVLSIVLDERGPTLSCRAVAVEVAAEDLTLRGRRVAIAAEQDLRVSAGGSLHSRVTGVERREAAAIELQANDGTFAVRAREDILLDGEMVHLNGDRSPGPFPWSQPAAEVSR